MAGLLEIRGMTVELPTAAGWVKPVNEVSLQIGAGECVGLVGESGSGKTMLSLALMGLLPPGARLSGEIWLRGGETKENTNAKVPFATVAEGEVEEGERSPQGLKPNSVANAVMSDLKVRPPKARVISKEEEKRKEEDTDRNLVELSEEEWRGVRGREIAMIFQEPMTSLNPVMRVGEQIEEAILAHEPGLRKEALHQRLMKALEHASVPEPEVRARQFPHQLSGGLRQRAMIAMALAQWPKLLIADEPTTALDVTVQRQILDLLDKLRREFELGLLFITHDLGVVAKVADRVAVMYAGRIVEEGPTEKVLTSPAHPYTQGLLSASPTLERRELTPIPGTVPRLTELPRGCAFAPRCSFRRAECEPAVPEFRKAEQEHKARCVLVDDVKR
jgi:oligopeptide/dipeptide ABC transporter ATP-binding protein